jgi:hypothetical protein
MQLLANFGGALVTRVTNPGFGENRARQQKSMPWDLIRGRLRRLPHDLRKKTSALALPAVVPHILAAKLTSDQDCSGHVGCVK